MGNSLSEFSKLKDKSQNSIDADIDDTSWLKAVDNSFVYVWCDESIGTQKFVSDANNTLRNIASIANPKRQLVHTFNELDACKDFIMHVNNVCLIISGKFGEELIPKIHNAEQLHSVYVFCMNKPKHDAWAVHYRKVRDVCTNIGDICKSLKKYISSPAIIDYDRIDFDIISTEAYSTEPQQLDLNLVYSILTDTFILGMVDSADHGKQDMVKYCRNEYTSDCQLYLIGDFEKNYSQFSPIWWYTKSYFFQGMINRALRTRDLYVLCSLQRLLKDLNIELTRLQEKQKKTTGSLDLYFVQTLATAELRRLQASYGQLMCINQFISANPDKTIAIVFMKHQALKSNQVRILFHIHIDQTLSTIVPYANIGSNSDFVHENEHLISMFGYYRVGKVEQVADFQSTWLVNLTLIGKDDYQYMQLKHHRLENMYLVDLDQTVKDRICRFKSANKLFRQALYNTNNQMELRAIVLHYNLALLYDSFAETSKSLEQYQCALAVARRSIPNCQHSDHICLVPIFANMGLTFLQSNECESATIQGAAIAHGIRAIGILSKNEQISTIKKELESACYIIYGIIHERIGQTSDAQKYFNEALAIQKMYLPSNHPDVIYSERLIALLSSKLSSSDSFKSAKS
ncbi:unnamed protein product [Adineta ricciae]|uniref:Uncharacterized protein n=1 Tax=Adineta ricciae TaxID=249248 RepID=A0A814HUU2_ADIRI|nr:unnamed protein product [Adineta ricciae]CAF1014965.1 unnamed protein product [Adineta ricciae]